MTLTGFYVEVTKACNANPTWRYGQALFNTLLDHDAKMAEEIRGTELDPFYLDHTEPNHNTPSWERIYSYISENWKGKK